MNSIWLTILLSLTCKAQENWAQIPIQGFGGVDTYHDSGVIDDHDAQDARNVLTDAGSLEKRPGNRRIVDSGLPNDVRFVGEYVNGSGTRYLIYHSSDAVWQTNLGGAPVKLSTTSTSYEVDCTTIFGNLYCGNNFDNSWFWNGTSTGVVSGMPKCKFLIGENERVYCANTNNSNVRVEISSYGGAGYWTVPSILTVDSPAFWDFVKNDGTGITCFKSTPWGKFVGKPGKTFVLKGYDNNTYYVRPVDMQIGCVDNRTVQMVEGNLVWLGQNGVYSWNGTGAPVLISQEIDNTVKQFRQLSSNSGFWNVTTQAEFQQGDLTASGAGAPISATIYSGAITPSSATFQTIHTSATLVQVSTTLIPSGTSSLDITSAAIVGGHFSASAGTDWTCNVDPIGGNTSCDDNYSALCPSGSTDPQCLHLCGPESCSGSVAVLKIKYISGVDGTTVLQTDTITGNNSGQEQPQTRDMSGITASTSVLVQFYNSQDSSRAIKKLTIPKGFNLIFEWKMSCTASGRCPGYAGSPGAYSDHYISNVRLSSYPAVGTATSQTFDTTVSTPVFGPFQTTISSNSLATLSFQEQDSADGASWGTAAALVPGNRPALQRRYWRLIENFANSRATMTATATQPSTLAAQTTGYYNSAVHFVGSALTSWLAFDATEASVAGGSNTYWVRSSTNFFTIESSTPSWLGQPNHQNIVASTGVVSTGLYYQWRTLFNLNSATNTLVVTDVNSQWQEGTSVPAASLGFEQRYYLCGMYSTTTIKNDLCAVYQRNKKWTLFDGPSYYSIGLYNKIPTAGSGNGDGYLWNIMRPDLYSDDGAAISAYWITKDFSLGAPFNVKTLYEIWTDAKYNTYASSVTIGFAPNKGSSFTSKDVNLNPSSGFVSTFMTLDDGYKDGKYFKFKLSNSTNDHYMKVNSVSAILEKKATTHD